MARSLCRLHLRVPAAYVAGFRALSDGQKRLVEDVAQRIEARRAFERPSVVMQDPTDETRLTAIARSTGNAVGPSSDPVAIERVEIVDDPRPLPRARVNGEALDDPGLLPEEIWTVQRALAVERDGRHLRGLASTLEPWFPVAASLLHVRALSLEPGSGLALREASSAPRRAPAEIDEARRRFEAYAARSDMPIGFLRDEARRAACELVHDGTLRRPRGFPAPIADLATTLVRPVGEDPDGPVRVVDGASVRRALSPDERQGFVSPAALQLAQSLGKPEMSGVANRASAPRRASAIEGPLPRGGAARRDTILARAMLDKAHRTLERQRWMRWYARRYETEERAR